MKHLLLLTSFVSSIVSTPLAYANTTVPVSIDSDPQGVTFSFDIPNEKFTVTGKTPARINDVPSGKAIVHFETLENCIAPKPQNRVIGQDQPMHFFGRYNCGNSGVTPEIIEQPALVPAKQISARVSPSQLEALPGSAVQFTVAVHNDAATINTPVTVRFTYDASQMNPTHIPNNGVQVQPGIIEWTLSGIPSNQTWSAGVKMQLSTNVHTNAITASVSAQGAEVRTATASTQVGTPGLPATGFSIDTLFAVFTSLTGAAYAWRKRLA
jgi:hypothetical protein